MVEESHHDFETFYQNGLELILDYNEDRISDKGSLKNQLETISKPFQNQFS